MPFFIKAHKYEGSLDKQMGLLLLVNSLDRIHEIDWLYEHFTENDKMAKCFLLSYNNAYL